MADQSLLDGKQSVVDLTPLQEDILRVLLYFDIFRHPLRADEISRYLSRLATTPDIVTALHAHPLSHLAGDDLGFYYVRNGFDKPVAERLKKERRAKRYYIISRIVGQVLRRLPFVRGVFISGELSKGVASKGTDLDLVVVTADRRLWLTRTILTFIKKVFLFNSHKFWCTNLMVTEDGLREHRHNLYTALEIATLQPLYNDLVFTKYLQANGWVTDFFPSFQQYNHELSRTPKQTLTQRILELPFRSRIADQIETSLYAFWKDRWRRRNPHLTPEALEETFYSTPTISARYGINSMPIILSAYEQKLREYGISKNGKSPQADPSIDVLLTHSYFLHFDPKEHRAMMPYPPLGTLYASSYLRSRGLNVALHDVMLSTSEREIESSLRTHHPSIVVVYDDEFNYLTKMCLSRMREAAIELTRLSKQHGCTVIIFSSDATDHLEEYFAHGADYVICGEAEITLGELCENLLGKSTKQPHEIAGLAYLENGKIRQTPRRLVLEKLDILPFPAWELIDVETYRMKWKERHGYFSLNLVTTRGCPFHCNWCAKPIYGQVYHSRTPANVVEEMKLLQKTLHPEHIWFCDDIFGLKPGWIRKFDEVVNREGAKIPFKCLSRADLLLKEDTVQHLKSAGCATVWIGAESGSQKILDAMEKGTTIAQIYESSRLLHESGIRVGFFLQFGYPGETKEDIEKTLTMIKECGPDEIGISVSYPLPGTKFYERVKAELGEKHNWVDSQDLDMMFHGTYSREYYRVLHRVVHKKFRVWRGRNTARNILSDPLSVKMKSFRTFASMAFHGLSLPFELMKLRSHEPVQAMEQE